MSRFYMIGIIKNKNSIVGYRLIDLDNIQTNPVHYFDATVMGVVNAVKSRHTVENLKITSQKIVGIHGVVSRYPIVGHPERQAMTVIKSVNDGTYIAIDVNGQKFNATEGQLIRYSNEYGLTNVKNVDNKYISGINFNLVKGADIGNVEAVQPPIQPIQKPIQPPVQPIQPIQKPAQPVQPAKPAIEKPDNQYDVGEQTNPIYMDACYEYRLKQEVRIGADGKPYWAPSNSIGFGVLCKSDIEDYVIKAPKSILNGVPVTSMQNTYCTLSNKLVDLRDFDFSLVTDFYNIMNKTTGCWLAVDSIGESYIIRNASKLFEGFTGTIVTETDKLAKFFNGNPNIRVKAFKNATISGVLNDLASWQNKATKRGIMACLKPSK